MFSLDGSVVEVPCPKCHFINPISLRQVRIRDAVICRGCKVTINLDDHMNETRKAIRVFNDLTRRFSKTINLTIKI